MQKVAATLYAVSRCLLAHASNLSERPIKTPCMQGVFLCLMQRLKRQGNSKFSAGAVVSRGPTKPNLALRDWG